MFQRLSKYATAVLLIAGLLYVLAYGDASAQQQSSGETTDHQQSSDHRYAISAFTSSGINGPNGVFHPPYHGAYVIDTQTGDVSFVQHNGTIKHLGSVAEHDRR